MLDKQEITDEYFNMLEDWKRLPAYKLEVRIDSFVGFALPRVIESIYGFQTKVIIPELPIRLGTVHPEHEGKDFAERSYKVDFYIRTECRQNLFIEFKTDSGSRREKQDHYLNQCTKVQMKSIAEGILKIYKATSYKKKYGYLLDKLQQAELIAKMDDELESIIDAEEIKLIYIQPRILEHDEDKTVIDFNQLAAAIIKCFPNSDMMKRLSSSLSLWAID